MTTSSIAATYDRLPYQNLSYVIVHPGRLQALALQAGIRAPNPSSSRVLELGCAAGWNLLPLSGAYPGIYTLGIDLSPVQIEDGLSAITDTGLERTELRCADIMDIDESWGTFDYVLCHGVYSWVPPAVQAKILSVCRERLSPVGLAMISYNVHPMWRIRGLVRDIMQYHLSQRDPLPEREAVAEARELISKLAGLAVRGPLRDLIGAEVRKVLNRPDSYVFHEFLEEHNEALYFHEFAERAAAAGLAYVDDATVATRAEPHIPAQAQALLDPLPVVQREQYFDFLFQSAIRYTIVTRAEVDVAPTRSPEAFAHGHIRLLGPPKPASFDASTDAPLEVEIRGRKLTLRSAVAKLALERLAQRVPESVEFSKLGEKTSQAVLCNELRTMYDSGVVELFVEPPRVTREISERPLATAFARYQARRSETVTNQYHEPVKLDAMTRGVLRRLDGTRAREALVDSAAKAVNDGEIEFAGGAPPRSSIQRHVANALQRLQSSALLVG